MANYQKTQEVIEPPDEETAKRKYPIKTVNSIYRVQGLDGREWLFSRQFWLGLDRNGNEVGKSFDDSEIWIKPVPRYETKPVDPNDRFSKLERKATGIGSEVKMFEKPFTAKSLDEVHLLPLTAGLNGGKKTLLIMKIDQNGERIGNPYVVEKYEDFSNRPFDELWEYATTSRSQEFTKLGKEEIQKNNKQYG